MIITTKFNSPELMCKALTKIVEKNVGRVSCRPYNYRKATYTDWFIVPISDSWPAYKHGKYFCDWQGDTDLLCGILIEKGLDQEVKAGGLYTSPQAKRCIMEKDWLWYRFLDDLESGRFENTIKFLAKELPISLSVRFSGGYFEDQATAEPYESLLKQDIYLMQSAVGSDSYELVASKPEGKNFRSLESATSFNDITTFINKMNEDAYMWLDILVGILLRYKDIKDIPENEREEWTAEMIWDNFLKHFLPWFR